MNQWLSRARTAAFGLFLASMVLFNQRGVAAISCSNVTHTQDYVYLEYCGPFGYDTLGWLNGECDYYCINYHGGEPTFLYWYAQVSSAGEESYWDAWCPCEGWY